MSRPALIRVRSLQKDYPRQRFDAPFYARMAGRLWGWTGAFDEWNVLNEGIPVLKGVDLDVFSDETLAIVGKSGAGKSTLLHLIGALDRPTKGTVLYRDQDLAQLAASSLDRWRNTTVGFVFQFYHLFPDLSALENVLLPAMVANTALAYRRNRDAITERARALLNSVGLSDREKHRPSQLSGGEQQRVAIARALILEPELLLCDEPTGNLDRTTGEEVLELLWKLKREHGQTYVIVTHDERLAKHASRVVRMEDGRILSVEPGGLAKGGDVQASAASAVEVQEGLSAAPATPEPVEAPAAAQADAPAEAQADAPAEAQADAQADAASAKAPAESEAEPTEASATSADSAAAGSKPS